MAANDVAARFGELLRDHRRAAGLTQEELAERAGISPRSISELERGGAHVPRRDTVSLLARALDLSGPARDAFEALVDQRRKARSPSPPSHPAHVHQVVAAPPPGADRAAHNVPRLLTSFVGRESEIEEIASLLAAAPLLTLVGAGGVGKTRLAQELVRRQAASYADGAWLVELAGLAEPSLLPGAVATAVGLQDVQARNVMSTLADYLRRKQLLLVLDNCEHLIGACATLAAQLLGACPRLHVLTTSREPLAIPGETIRQVQPLSVPDARQAVSPDQILDSAAARLFLERARAANPTFTLTAQNAPAIARVCIGVDGIPLALELAAARARMLTVEQIADRLGRDVGILAATNRAGLPQHQTMRATLDWSHGLLGVQEQILLRRLSVFAGGFTLVAVEGVCAGSGIESADLLHLLAQLVDRSMVLVDARDTVARYRLLEPIRQYASERLEAAGEAATYRGHHSAAFLNLVLLHEAGGPGPDEITSLNRLEVEHDNLRAALQWALAHGQGAAALRCSAALFRFWERRGHFQEGCTWLEQALRGAQDAPTAELGWALNALAFLYWRGGDPERAWPIAEQALAISRLAGTPRDVAQGLLSQGMIAHLRNEPALALSRLEESVAAAREGGYLPQLSVALAFLGRALLRSNGPFEPGVDAALEESLGLARQAQSLYATGHALAGLGDLAWEQGDGARALLLWQQALGARARLADRRGVAGCLERLAMWLAASHRFEPAAWLFGAADAQYSMLGITLRHDDEIEYQVLLALTRASLGETFAAAWSAGQAAPPDDAVTRALDETRQQFSPGAAQRGAPRLSREAVPGGSAEGGDPI